MMAENTFLNRVKSGRIYKGYKKVKDRFTSLFQSKSKPERIQGPSLNLMKGGSVTFVNPPAGNNIIITAEPTRITFGSYDILICGLQLFPLVKACQRLDGRLHIEVNMSETNDDNYEQVKVSSTSIFLNGCKSQEFEFGPKKKIVIEMPSSLPEDALRVIGPVSGTVVITGVAMPGVGTEENVAASPTVEGQGNNAQASAAETNAEPESNSLGAAGEQ